MVYGLFPTSDKSRRSDLLLKKDEKLEKKELFKRIELTADAVLAAITVPVAFVATYQRAAMPSNAVSNLTYYLSGLIAEAQYSGVIER